MPHTTRRPALDAYRVWLRSRILDFGPARLLDVGCGDGSLLDWAERQGIEAVGVDPSPRASRPAVLTGYAEQLPFPTARFDLVVFEFSLHHASDPALAIAEAKRVSRSGVVIALDPWFCPGLPGQALAERFDRWSKRIDRLRGMDHLDCFTPDAFRALAADGRLDLSYLIHLEWRDRNEMIAYADDHVRDADDEAVSAYAGLRPMILEEGLTESGVQLAVFS